LQGAIENLGEFADRVFQTFGSGPIGTPRYMSPEQAAGEELTGTSDLYSMGLVLYEMLTGKFPFEADAPMAFLACHMIQDPIPLARADSCTEFLPAELHGLLDRVLRKDAEERPQSARAMVEEIDRILPRVMDL
jgi:serine/threonine protein kinase